MHCFCIYTLFFVVVVADTLTPLQHSSGEIFDVEMTGERSTC